MTLAGGAAPGERPVGHQLEHARLSPYLRAADAALEHAVAAGRATILGHAQLTTTQVYLIADDAEVLSRAHRYLTERAQPADPPLPAAGYDGQDHGCGAASSGSEVKLPTRRQCQPYVRSRARTREESAPSAVRADRAGSRRRAATLQKSRAGPVTIVAGWSVPKSHRWPSGAVSIAATGPTKGGLAARAKA